MQHVFLIFFAYLPSRVHIQEGIALLAQLLLDGYLVVDSKFLDGQSLYKVDWPKRHMSLFKGRSNLPIWGSVLRFDVWSLMCDSTSFQLSAIFSKRILSWNSSSALPGQLWTCLSLVQQTDRWSQVDLVDHGGPQKYETNTLAAPNRCETPTWWVGRFFDLAKRGPNLPGRAEECGGLVHVFVDGLFGCASGRKNALCACTHGVYMYTVYIFDNHWQCVFCT